MHAPVPPTGGVKRVLLKALHVHFAFFVLSAPARGDSIAHPFPQHVDYVPSALAPTHRSQAQQDDDVRALYEAWKLRYIAQAGTEADGHPRYRVKMGRGANAATVSEGQGYGMLIAVLMAGHDPTARVLFDGLWEFSLDHPSEIDARLMDWRVEADEVPDPSGNDSAFDGDCNMAAALLMAALQWGGSQAGGRFDYRVEAGRVLSGIEESTLGPASRLPLLGDWVVPGGSVYSEFTPRPSDFIFFAFLSFARSSADPLWLEVEAMTRGALADLRATVSPATALVPDFLQPVTPGSLPLRPADPNFLESPYDGDYYYNSLRVPLWQALHALTTGEEDSADHAAALTQWVRGATGDSALAIRAGYTLDGTPLPGSDYFTTAFAAPLGAAAMLDPSAQLWLEEIYELARVSDEDYYEDSLSLLSLLVMTRNFWQPYTFPVPGDDSWRIEGTAQGGFVQAELEGVEVVVVTEAGATALEVAWDFARVVNADPALRALAVTAVVRDGAIVSNGDFGNRSIADAGLFEAALPVPALPPGGFWILLVAWPLALGFAPLRRRAERASAGPSCGGQRGGRCGRASPRTQP